MQTTVHFKWSTRIMMRTVVLLLLFLGLAAFCGYRALTFSCGGAFCCGRSVLYLTAAGLLLLVVLMALLNMPRRIVVDKQAKRLVLRLAGYAIAVPFDEIESIQALPQGERLSIQLFGTTGLFGCNGFYRTRSKETMLGFITDMSCVYIIRRRGKRPIAVSIPDLPDLLG